MTTTVSYHVGDLDGAHPAVDIKLHCAGIDMRSTAVDDGMTESDSDAIHELAYERVQSDFWQAAEELAAQTGLGAILQEGRSGGWLAFTDMEADDELDAAWLKAYRTFKAWADAEVDAAPARVAALAQSMAMDDIGSRAVNRPYRELTLAEYRANGAATFYGTGR